MSTMSHQAKPGTLVQFPVQKNHLKFTDVSLSHLKAPGYYYDQLLPGFGCRKGKKRLCFICVREGRRKKIGLWPSVSLQEARSRARDYLASLDPAAPLQPRITYLLAVDEYLRQHKGRPRTKQEYERLLKRFPFSAALSQIHASHILKQTDALQHVPTERLHLHTAYRAFFNWCVPRYLAKSPMENITAPLKPDSRSRVLSPDELRKVWHASTHLEDFGRIVKLCILTAQRRGELSKVGLTNIAGGLLTIPAHITKNRREHTIPLSSTAVQLFRELGGCHFNCSAKKRELDKLSGVSGYTIHDLRRTAASLMVAPPISAQAQLVERVLNHITGSGTQLQHTYQRYAYEPEIKDLFDRYHAHLQTILDGVRHTTASRL